MNSQPFREEDVLYRYTPPGIGEVVFVKSEPSNVYPVTMYYHAGRHWECANPSMRDVAELLRQKDELRKEWNKLRDALIEIQNTLYLQLPEETEIKVEEIVRKALASKKTYLGTIEDSKETKP